MGHYRYRYDDWRAVRRLLARGLPVRAVAARAGVSKSTVHEWGRRGGPPERMWLAMEAGATGPGGRSGRSPRQRLDFECVLSSLVEPLPSRICEPLPVAWRRMPNGIRHDKVSHPRHRNPSRSRQAPPPMRAWRTRQDSPLNCTSLPWWTTLSITAAAIWSSPKTLPQRLNSRLVVKTTDCRS